MKLVLVLSFGNVQSISIDFMAQFKSFPISNKVGQKRGIYENQ